MPPDDPALTPTDPVDPAAAAAADPAGDPPAPVDPAADPGGDPPTPAGDPDPRPHGNKGQTPWYMRRIAEETERRQRAEAQADEDRRARADAQALLERLQRGGSDTQPAPTARPATAPQPGQDDFDRAVAARAAQQRLYDDSLDVRNAGVAAFQDFGDTLGILNAVGVTNDDILADLFAVDKANAHVILDKLAKDPERAAAMVKMDPRRRTAEFTRMSMAEQKPAAAAAPAAPAAPAPAARAVSRAPAPRPAVEPVSPATNDWQSDEADDEAFSRGWDQQYRKRA